MRLPAYHIFVDGRGYAGEGTGDEDAPPRHTGWTGRSPQTRNVLAWGDPMLIEGRKGLRSHLDRILDRLGDEHRIEILRVVAVNAPTEPATQLSGISG